MLSHLPRRDSEQDFVSCLKNTFLLLIFPQAQKELLDTELDLHKRLSSGEDTTELRKKLNQLQVEVRLRGVTYYS